MTTLGIRDCDDFNGDVWADVAAWPLPEGGSELARGAKRKRDGSWEGCLLTNDPGTGVPRVLVSELPCDHTVNNNEQQTGTQPKTDTE